MPEQSLGEDFPNQLYGWVKENDGTWSLYAPDGTLIIASRNGRAQVSEPASDFDVANKKYGDEHWSGGSQPGAPSWRYFDFAFDTDGLADGVVVFTPTTDIYLLDAIFEIDEAWDGTTPLGDVGVAAGSPPGMFAYVSNSGVDMTQVWYDGSGGGVFLNPGLGVQVLSVAASGQSPPFGNIFAPARVAAGTPVKVWVSQDGNPGGDDPGSTAGAARLIIETFAPVVFA